MAALFEHLGYAVGAQKSRHHGQAHNYPPFWPFEAAYNNHKYLIQVVRTPSKVVESAFLAEYFIPRVYSERIPSITKGDPSSTRLEQVVNSVVLWNEAISKAKPDLVVKVEEAESVCRKWLDNNDLGWSEQGKPPPHNVNHRINHGWNLTGKVPWEELGDKHREMLKEHCLKYRYPDAW